MKPSFRRIALIGKPNTSEIEGSLREMQRLEGVVRTKTAEGKAQLYVLAVFPAGITYALHKLSPGYFDPLTENLIGYIVLSLAIALWIGSILMARKILNVDI